MRLTCPNCGAQYEVPETVIPDSGRDVQCSNCGTTWFQNHPDHASPEPPEPDIEPEPTPEPDPECAPEPEPNPAAQRRLDPSVAGILREEADRERAARAAESDGRMETQPDLGLTEPEPEETRRARQARDRMQRLRGDPPATRAGTPRCGSTDTEDIEYNEEQEDDDIDPSSRRNLFPDIEEINSSLSSPHDNKGPLAPAISEDMAPAPGHGGFRAGFRLAVVICVAALAVYLMAPRIAGLWPVAEAPLAHYVQAVDDGRAVLSATVSDLLARF